MATKCELGIRDTRKGEWNYSLWDSGRCVRTGTLNLRNIKFHITPQMAERLALVLEGIEAA